MTRLALTSLPTSARTRIEQAADQALQAGLILQSEREEVIIETAGEMVRTTRAYLGGTKLNLTSSEESWVSVSLNHHLLRLRRAN